MIKIKSKELQLGDVISPVDNNYPFSTSIVEQIKDGLITIFRPYGTTADFSCTAGVICYTGIEEYRVSQDSDSEWLLWERKSLK